MEQQVELIYDYIKQRELQRKSDFVATLNAHVLLYKRWQVSRPQEKTMTTTFDGPPNDLLLMLDEQRRTLHKEAFDFRLLRLSLSRQGWSVGRVSGNDLVLGHHSISKHHAQLALGADSSVLVTDGGSKNGTWVENRRVTPNRPVLIWSKQVLRLGSISLRFLVAADFYDLLGGMVVPA